MSFLDRFKSPFQKELETNTEAKPAQTAPVPKPKKTTKFRARYFTPPEGHTYNPLCSYPVNKKCWCGSGYKAKRCCKPFVPPLVKISFAENIKVIWGELMLGKVTLPGAFPKRENVK